MRLGASIGLWLAGMTALVLGGHGWMQLRTEREDLVAARRWELTLLTTAVRSAVENAVRDKQQPDVASLLDQLELRDPAIDVYVLGENGAVIGSSWGSEAKLAAARRIADGARGLDTLRIEDLGDAEFAAIAPVRPEGMSLGRVVIIQPGDTLRADLAAERRATIISIILLIVVLSGVIWGVIRLRLDQPMRRVIVGIRAIGRGDLSTRIQLTGTDEVAEIAREFDAMTAALQEARQKLDDETERRERMGVEMQRANRLAIVGQLAATLAHEIGSPLQVLSGRAQALAERSDLPPDAARSVGIMVQQTERVHHIVERLLDVARRKAPKPVWMDVRESVTSVMELVAVQARRLRVRLVLEADEIPQIHADADQVQQILLNLLQNALRACSKGGVVRVAVGQSSFLRADSREQRSVFIDVTDSGPGIPDDLRSRIFEPFVTAWQNGGGSKGSGLGLAVVQSIVTEHGGIVQVSAPPTGTGARFTVHFPLAAPPEAS